MDALSEARMIARSQGRWGASQGSYFKAMNPTPGTGIIGPGGTQAFSATSALFVWRNTAPATSNVFVFPDYVKLLVTVVDTSATAMHYLFALDTIPRFNSGGTSLMAAANANGPVNVLRSRSSISARW